MLKNLLFTLYNLNIKKAIGVSLLLSLVMAVPLIYLLLQREGQIFTEAGKERPIMLVDESKVPYPTEPPQIVYIDKYYGKPGDSILIYGHNFGAAQKESKVLLNNKAIRKDDVVYWSDEELEISLPGETGLYQITVFVNGNRGLWDGKLNVYSEQTTPVITINEKTGFIKVDDPKIVLEVIALNDNVRVFGTNNYVVKTKNIPIELVNSTILYLGVTREGVTIPYNVSLQ